MQRDELFAEHERTKTPKSLGVWDVKSNETPMSKPTLWRAVGPWRISQQAAHNDALQQERFLLLGSREPTQAEGDDADTDGDGRCFIALGGWVGIRCRFCRRWVWGGDTSCGICVSPFKL